MKQTTRLALFVVLVAQVLLAPGCSPLGRSSWRPAGGVKHEVEVDAGIPWTDTGVDVRSGEQVWFESSGKAKAKGLGRCDADGFSDRPEWQENNVVKGANHMALIGRIGEHGWPFVVGTEATFQARHNGRLYLGINDADCEENSGKYRVDIHVFYSETSLAGTAEESPPTASPVAQSPDRTPTVAPPTSTSSKVAPTETATEGVQEISPAEPGIVLNSEPENGLLFRSTGEGIGTADYYGSISSGLMRVTHVAIEHDSGEYSVIIFDDQLLPVQWITPWATIAVQKTDKRTPYDAHSAHHVAFFEETREDIAVDIYPGDLFEIVEDMEMATGQEYDNARSFLTQYDISTYDDLLELARQPGPQQPVFVVAATAFSSSAAALRLAAHTGKAQVVPAAYTPGMELAMGWGSMILHLLNKLPGELMKHMFGELLDLIYEWLVPHLPGTLLCNGVSGFPGLCLRVLFHQSAVMDCVAFCKTSMSCFTDICMPYSEDSREFADLVDRFLNGLK